MKKSRALGGGFIRSTTVIEEVHRTVWIRRGVFGLESLGIVLRPNAYAGRILVFNADIKRWQIVTSVYHALRQTMHILERYGISFMMGETGLLLEARNAFRQMNLMMLGLGSGADAKTVRRIAEETLAEASQTIRIPRRMSKRTALDHLSALKVGIDSRGHVNPSAFMARAIAGYEALLGRHEEIFRIDPNIVRRQAILIRLIQWAENTLEAFDADFLKLLLKRDGFKPLFDPSQRRMTAQHCRYLASDLERLDFHPYRNTCWNIAKDLRAASDILRRKNITAANWVEFRNLLIKCQNAVAIKSIQIDIERLIYRITLVLQKDIPQISWASTDNTLERIARQLSRVNESDFRRPVCAAARQHIDAAIVLASKHSAETLPEVKDAMKNASAEL